MGKNVVYKQPRRAEIWLVVDRNKKKKQQKEKEENDSSVQEGTRTCIVISNNAGNMHSTVVEIVYTTTAQKTDLPTHFITRSTPRPSTVICEQIMTVPKKNLVRYYGKLTEEERKELNKCLKVSIDLDD